MAFPEQVDHGSLVGSLCILKKDHLDAKRFVDHDVPDEPCPYYAGQVVKVTVASRFGDCGISSNLKAINGYDLRVMPDELEPISGLTPWQVSKLINLLSAYIETTANSISNDKERKLALQRYVHRSVASPQQNDIMDCLVLLDKLKLLQ